MNEADFARKITTHLSQASTELQPAQLARLRTARERAVASVRQPAVGLSLALGGGRTLKLPRFSRKTLISLVVITIAAAWFGYNQWSQDDYYDNVGELDAQLLTGELPINAFLDKDFESWVKESAE